MPITVAIPFAMSVDRLKILSFILEYLFNFSNSVLHIHLNRFFRCANLSKCIYDITFCTTGP